MSWEAENNSARSPTIHDQIATPQRTHTARLVGNLFETQRIGTGHLDSSRWTPVFAEEYTLFNATPGRFTPTKPTFSPRPTAAAGHKRQHSSTETLRLDTTRKEGQTPRSTGSGANSGLPSPATTKSPLLGRGLEKLTKSTPNRASRVAEGTFTSQTATPPQSRHKHARRASLAEAPPKMQSEQDFYHESGGMGGGYDLSFATPTNVDLFSFPMSGPATAPAYMNGKSFWDPSNGMTDMSMDFADPFAASGDWILGGSMSYQQPTDTPQPQQDNGQSSRKPRPLAAKPPAGDMPPVQSGVTFDFGMASLGENPFSMSTTGGVVDPNSLFSFPSMTPPRPSNAAFNTPAVHVNPQIETRPQPSLMSPLNIPRAQSAQSKHPDSSHRPMLRPVSPLKVNRSNARRPTNDNLTRPSALKSAAPLCAEAQPPSNFAGKGRYSSGTGTVAFGTRSATKHGSSTNLQAISERGVTEKLFNPRAAVTFSIDANGRARTETTVVMGKHEHSDTKPRTAGSSNSRPSPREEQTMSGSSTDEEVIVIPSRNPSFAQKNRTRSLAMPKMARFETGVRQYPRVVSGGRQLSAGNVKALSKAAFTLDDDTDEEEVDMARRRGDAGDAAKALRKVMENRRRSASGITSMPPSSNVSTIRISSSHRNGGQDRDRHNRRQSYAASATYSASTPSTVTDFDGDLEMLGAATSSTVESQGTRCVCHRKEKMDDEFMIQCESCEHWQHSTCVRIDPRELPKVYICAFCAQTPNMRGRKPDRQRETEREVVIPDRESPLGRYRWSRVR